MVSRLYASSGSLLAGVLSMSAIDIHNAVAPIHLHPGSDWRIHFLADGLHVAVAPEVFSVE
jgi:hypothetical protein